MTQQQFLATYGEPYLLENFWLNDGKFISKCNYVRDGIYIRRTEYSTYKEEFKIEDIDVTSFGRKKVLCDNCIHAYKVSERLVECGWVYRCRISKHNYYYNCQDKVEKEVKFKYILNYFK